MKQFFLLCQFSLCAAMGTTLHAQFNSSYAVPGVNINAANTLLASSWNDVYSTAHLPAAMGELYLTRTDNTGNVIRTVLLHHVNHNGKLVETFDGGVLLAAYQNDDKELGIYKFDAALNLLWSRYVPIGAAVQAIRSRIDIEKTTIADEEKYFILCASATYYPQYENTDAAFSLVCVKDDGNLLWHRKYADANRLSSGISTVRDMPSGITSVLNGNKRWFLLAGAREEWSPSPAHSLFLQLVDENGAIISQFKKVSTTGKPNHVDLTNDTKTFICSFTDENSTISGDPVNASGICLMPVPLNLTPGFVRYFWQPQTVENYALSIRRISNGDYVLGCHGGVGNNNPTDNISLLRLTASTLLPQYYKRFNVEKRTANYNELAVDASNYNYLVGTVYPGLPGTPYPDFKYRVIKSDPSGNACGAISYPLSYTNYPPVLQPYMYQAKDYADIYHQEPVIDEVSLIKDNCDPAGNYNTYNGKAAGWPLTTTTLKVYPSLLEAGDRSVHCEISTASPARVTIRVYNVLGQLVNSREDHIAAGNTALEVSAETWTKGMHFVRVYLDGKLQQTAKVIRR